MNKDYSNLIYNILQRIIAIIAATEYYYVEN